MDTEISDQGVYWGQMFMTAYQIGSVILTLILAYLIIRLLINLNKYFELKIKESRNRN